MAENYKHMYEQMKKVVTMYQDEIVPGMRKEIEDLEKNQIKVRCKGCKHWHEETGWCDVHSHFVDRLGDFCYPEESPVWKDFDADYFCKDGERKDNE